MQDSFLTASTEDSSFPASGGRLEEDSTSWCSLDPHQLLWPYLQVDFDTVVDVTTLRTAGHEDPDRHVESFRVLVDGGSGGSLNSINASATSMVGTVKNISDKKFKVDDLFTFIYACVVSCIINVNYTISQRS